MIRPHHIIILFPLLLLLLACGVSPRRGYQRATPPPYAGGSGGAHASTQPSGTGDHPGVSAGSADALPSNPRAALEELDRRLRAMGYSPASAAVHNPSLPVNGLVGYAISAQPGLCYLAVALGSPGADVNLVVVGPNGAILDYHVEPGPYAWSLFCPALPGLHTARLQMVSGGGEYYYAVYQGSGAQRPDMAAWTGSGSRAAVQRVALDATTRARIEATGRQLADSEWLGEPHGVVLQEGRDHVFHLNLSQGVCYHFGAFGGSGARDIDIFIGDGAGNEVERDARPGLDAMVRFCAPQSGTYSLRARMHQGSGAVYVTGWVQRSAAGQAQGAAGQQTTANVIGADSRAGADVTTTHRLVDTDMRARGYEPYAEPVRARLAEGEARELPLRLEGDRCYAVLAVGDGGVRDLDLVLSVGGRVVDRDVEAHGRPSVRVCPDRNAEASVRVQMTSGAGEVVFSAYRWTRGTRGPFNLRGVQYVRLGELTALLEGEGFTPDTDSTPGRLRIAREGASANAQVRLAGGACYAVVVVGGDGVVDLDVEVARGPTVLGTDGQRSAFPWVRFCATEGGMYTVRVSAREGSGDVFHQVFRRAS
ncbi:MAG: hypothetical protein NZ898_08880 [Myxococcota bacterium]|nr:hypothetical protein [Myxococcota bacterium]MDW8360905.1 hypothetical protein [Myxococcales bacterium]